MIVLGRVVAPFGVRGWLKIHPFADDPGAWGGMRRWWLGADDNWQPYALGECREHGGGLVARLEGVADRSAAEALKGLLVAAPREELPEVGEDEFYWADLLGLRVENLAGDYLGEVAGLVDSGASQVLRVAGERERLLPFVAAVVKQVDPGARLIRVDWQPDW